MNALRARGARGAREERTLTYGLRASGARVTEPTGDLSEAPCAPAAAPRGA